MDSAADRPAEPDSFNVEPVYDINTPEGRAGLARFLEWMRIKTELGRQARLDRCPPPRPEGSDDESEPDTPEVIG